VGQLTLLLSWFSLPGSIEQTRLTVMFWDSELLGDYLKAIKRVRRQQWV
jgi:hypothetical protein